MGRTALVFTAVFTSACAVGQSPEAIALSGLKAEVEVLRDRWGVPHIYARNSDDLFFAQGYLAARDRLFQIDLWRRIGTGRLAEVLGPDAIPRDRLARLIRYRGDWNKEWESYSPDTKAIATAFTAGINAFIKGLDGKRPADFAAAGYDPGLWTAEDVTARMAGLLMVRNLTREVDRALRIKKHGSTREAQLFPPDPSIPLTIPKGLDLADIHEDVLKEFRAAARAAGGGDGDGWDDLDSVGSNNWVVSGALTVTGKPLLANDPHRPLLLPSLRKTWHLVAPGWNVIGAGEPALPGVALGHNEQIGFGFTIVGIDQADLYVETLNPRNPDEYQYKGEWRKFEIEKDSISVKGGSPAAVEHRYSIHGPVLYLDRTRNRAYSLKWVGAEPGGAGYLPALRLARTKDWKEFLAAAELYKVPSENLVYADRKGSIGWVAAGAAPIRKNWDGLLPVPGESGAFEWEGYLPIAEHPLLADPANGMIATANHNILPGGYNQQLSYEWATPYRFQRIAEMLDREKRFSVEDFRTMQQDVVSVAARRFQMLLKNALPSNPDSEKLLAWDAQMKAESPEALLFALWVDSIYPILFGTGQRPSFEVLMAVLEQQPSPAKVLEQARQVAHSRIDLRKAKTWGDWHQLTLSHPSGRKEWSLGPIPRPGDANTVNAASGPDLRQTNGPSWRQILDLSDWDKSLMTNVPGESGDPASPHYADLLDEWATGGYHQLAYSRRAVEKATVEKIRLTPVRR